VVILADCVSGVLQHEAGAGPDRGELAPHPGQQARQRQPGQHGALQSPDDGGDIFDDAFADPAEVAERAEKKKKEAAAAASAGSSDAGAGRAAGGMDSAMKKRQEDTAAEVCLCCWFQYLNCSIFYLSYDGEPIVGRLCGCCASVLRELHIIHCECPCMLVGLLYMSCFANALCKRQVRL